MNMVMKWSGMVLMVALGGCATPTSEDDFGNSVRTMIEAQKYTPPEQNTNRLPSLDGQRAETAIEQYRNDTTPDATQNAVGGDAAQTSQQ